MNRKAKLVIGLVIFFLMTSACGLSDIFGPSNTTTFVNLPLPAGARHITNVTVQTVGDTEQVMFASDKLKVDFMNTGSGAGSNESEIVCLHTADGEKCATNLEFNWGDFWTDAKVSTTQAYDLDGNVIDGRITLSVKSANIINLFACGSCTIDRSRLILRYTPDGNGWLQLADVLYVEEYGFDSSKGVIALGQQAIWMNAANMFPQYAEWGFWEAETSPVVLVKNALENVKAKVTATEPSFKILDKDGLREVVGRQSGLDVYRDGVYYCRIELKYSNTWGTMPNTPYFGSGALSRISWLFANGTSYNLSVLASKLDPRPTAIYVFTKSTDAASRIESTNWTALYRQFREGEIKDVLLAIYSAGAVGDIKQYVPDGDGGGSTVSIGAGGGVFYGVMNKPIVQDVRLAHTLLNLMGRGGITATRFFYATQPGLGNGLVYYLAALTLIEEDPAVVLNKYGSDVALLDRVGFFDPSLLP